MNTHDFDTAFSTPSTGSSGHALSIEEAMPISEDSVCDASALALGHSALLSLVWERG